MIKDSIAQLAAKHDIKPLKKYGQNFIFDKSLCDKIVGCTKIGDDSIVLEIGPGPAGLTRSILDKKPKKLLCVEKDKRCFSLLEEIQSFYPNLDLKCADALKYDIQEISSDRKVDIISNLPYNVGTELLIKWLFNANNINSMVLMLQREVVDRIIAVPRSKDYGRLSIISQLLCNVEKCFDVSPKAFYPEPKIWSSIVKLIPKNNIIENKILKKIEKITNVFFSRRRKIIKSSLKLLVNNIDEVVSDLDFNLDLSVRPEELFPEQYFLLAKKLVTLES